METGQVFCCDLYIFNISQILVFPLIIRYIFVYSLYCQTVKWKRELNYLVYPTHSFFLMNIWCRAYFNAEAALLKRGDGQLFIISSKYELADGIFSFLHFIIHHKTIKSKWVLTNNWHAISVIVIFMRIRVL